MENPPPTTAPPVQGEIVKKELQPLPLTKPVTRLLDTYVVYLTSPKAGTTPIHVDEIASHVAKFYELIRKVIDWKEDNVLRRAATERILNRLLFSRLSGVSFSGHRNIDQIAETLTLDLIRGGHLKNDTIPQEKIVEISKLLTKYIYFIQHSPFQGLDPVQIKRRINYQTFILELASNEIEEILTEPVLETGLTRAMTESMRERTAITPRDSLSQDDTFVQTYIAVCRTLFDFDNFYIAYHMLVLQYPEWKSADETFIQSMNTQLPDIWRQLPNLLDNKLANKFFSLADRVDTVFVILGDIFNEFRTRPNELYNLVSNKTEMLRLAEDFYAKRYSTLKKRLINLAIFSTLSVFASNWVTYFLIEVPLASVFAEGFNPWTTIVDFLVPTFVMFCLVIIIRPPKAANKQRVLDTLASFVYENEPKALYEVRTQSPRRPIMGFLTTTTSLLITIVVLSLVAWVFWLAGLPITSVIFDTFTIALTVFAAVTIRNKSKELTVGEPTSFAEFLLDMVSVPVARLGSLLATKWKEYNIIAFIFTFLIETPFVKVVDIIEQWSQFLKERRAELH